MAVRSDTYMYTHIQYIPRNMHTVFALLRFVVVIHWLIFPYPSGLLHWHCGNLTIATVPAKQPWWIWIITSCEFIMNDCITTTKQSTTKPCAYFLGCTVFWGFDPLPNIMIRRPMGCWNGTERAFRKSLLKKVPCLQFACLFWTLFILFRNYIIGNAPNHPPSPMGSYFILRILFGMSTLNLQRYVDILSLPSCMTLTTNSIIDTCDDEPRFIDHWHKAMALPIAVK